jgi:hypothetical protein
MQKDILALSSLQNFEQLNLNEMSSCFSQPTCFVLTSPVIEDRIHLEYSTDITF